MIATRRVALDIDTVGSNHQCVHFLTGQLQKVFAYHAKRQVLQ